MEGQKQIVVRSFTSNKANAPLHPLIADKILLESDFSVENDVPIGVGGCSSVYVGKFQERLVAVKRYSIANPELSPAREMLLKEAETILRLDHINIIKCFGVCLKRGCLVLELSQITISKDDNDNLTLNSLRQLLDVAGDAIESEVELKRDALLQILKGLQYLHSKSIVHGDLKSANVLVSQREGSEGYLFKLTDFGGSHAQISSKIMSNISSISSKKVKPGTTFFEAPEVFTDYEKTCASDVYSFGMVVYELLYYRYSHPWESVFKQVNPIALASLIIGAVQLGKRPTIEERSPYTDTIELCWQHNPADRPSVASLNLKIQNVEVLELLISCYKVKLQFFYFFQMDVTSYGDISSTFIFCDQKARFSACCMSPPLVMFAGHSLHRPIYNPVFNREIKKKCKIYGLFNVNF